MEKKMYWLNLGTIPTFASIKWIKSRKTWVRIICVTGDVNCANLFSIHCTVIFWLVSFKGKELVRMGGTQWMVLRSDRFTPEKVYRTSKTGGWVGPIFILVSMAATENQTLILCLSDPYPVTALTEVTGSGFRMERENYSKGHTVNTNATHFLRLQSKTPFIT